LSEIDTIQKQTVEEIGNMSETPGGEIKGRPLHFIWMCDCSGSMAGQKIESLNFAIRESIPEMQSMARQHSEAEILVRAVAFSDTARWIISQPTKVEDFRWTDLGTEGTTAMGEALSLVATQFADSQMPSRGLPPVVVLISDGLPSDNFDSGLKQLMGQRWGAKAVRMAIAIGNDADKSVLARFIGNPEIPVLEANNPSQLVKYIKLVSTEAVASVIKPPSQAVPTATNGGTQPGSVTTANSMPMLAAASSGGSDDDFIW
jgi:uncharacterized protein YegL